MNAPNGMPRDGAARVSIVLPTHDRPELLAQAVESIRCQTMTAWELVIVDDASTPPVDARSLSDRTEGRSVFLRNRLPVGGAGSKALGARAARGDLVTFLDDDDLFAPDLLERATGVLDRHPSIDVLFLGVHWFGRQAGRFAKAGAESMARVLRVSPAGEIEPGVLAFDDRLFEGLLTAIPMDFQRVMVRRSALDRIGVHRVDCLMWDCDWALRAALAARCALLRVPVYLQRADGQEYYSRPERERAQMESALEIALRLRDRPPAGASRAKLDLLRAAASRHAGGLAHFHALHGPLRASLAAWWRSQQLQPGLASARVPLSALAHAARRRLRRGAAAEATRR